MGRYNQFGAFQSVANNFTFSLSSLRKNLLALLLASALSVCLSVTYLFVPVIIDVSRATLHSSSCCGVGKTGDRPAADQSGHRRRRGGPPRPPQRHFAYRYQSASIGSIRPVAVAVEKERNDKDDKR